MRPAWERSDNITKGDSMHTRRQFGMAALGVAVALLLAGAGQARAEVISMTLTLGTGPGAFKIDVDPFATATATSYSVHDLAALNTVLRQDGSLWTFTSLGGSSNFPGSGTMGQLILNGTVNGGGVGGPRSALTITETEAGFAQPTSPLGGTLMSSSSASFFAQPAGDGQAVQSLFNTTPTPLYTVLSTGTADNPGTNTGPQSVGVGPPLLAPYTLENVLSFGVSTPGLDARGNDTFGVTATLTATPTAVPEPASLTLLSLGAVGLLGYGWRRRKRATA
jgi:hypothetical protein